MRTGIQRSEKMVVRSLLVGDGISGASIFKKGERVRLPRPRRCETGEASIDRQKVLQPVLGRDQAQLGQRLALDLADTLA
jgi:hypothetical protein